jgi:GT2 family glycosyltransferase
LVRRQENARVTIDWETHLYRVRREIRSEKISIIINGAAARDAERIRAKTNFPNFEIVANRKEATGEYLLFLDSDLEPLDENWLSAMGEQLSNPKIGAVGPRIVSSDDTIESSGLILLPNGSAGSAFAGYPRNFRGANRQLQAVRNYSAVSASCLLTRREVFEKTASVNTGSFDFARKDHVCVGTEFCLNLREHGLRTVSIPYAEVRRASKRENARATYQNLQKRWPEMFRRDPYYNPNLSGERADFSLG